MRGLIKATHYYSTLEARKDWMRLVSDAVNQGRQDLVEQFQPPENANHRTIDSRIAKLRTALKEQEKAKQI